MERHRIDKAALRETIASFEGLTNEQKADLLQLLSEQKRYGLVWEDHAEDVEEQLRTQLPVLCEDSSKRILSADEEAPNHILIEGDNLHALTALTYTHEGRVDVIYIDPPYNTGEKDFIYNDNYIDSDDEFRHSKWLSFMARRLRIAKKLLKRDGVIYISIDDNEIATLTLLCDEIFGAKNHINTITINMNSLSGVKMTHVINGKRYPAQKEYLLIYANSEDRKPFYIEKLHKEEWDKEYNLIIPEMTQEFYESFHELSDKEMNDVLKEMHLFSLASWAKENEIELTDEWKWDNAFRIFGSKSNRPLALAMKDESFSHVIVGYTNKDGNKRLFRSDFNRNTRDPRIELVQALSNGAMFLSDNWIDISNDGGVAQEGGVTFPKGKKPLQLIKRIIRSANRKDAIYLDFFAGSGTTFQAVAELSEELGIKQCILVCAPEKNNICETKTYARCKNVICGYKKYIGLSCNNLRYYRTDFVERETTRTAKRQLMMASTELLCIKHDVYDEQPTFGNITLRPAIARYFADEKQQMLIIYRTEAIESLVAEIAQMPESTNILVYVFSTTNYAMNADFEEVSDKVTLCALPAAIYNAYLRVLPKRRMNDALRYDDDALRYDDDALRYDDDALRYDNPPTSSTK